MQVNEKVYWILEGEREAISFKDLQPDEILGPQELDRWREMRFQKRKDEFLFGRYTAKRLLTAGIFPWAHQEFRSFDILNETEGAPYLNKLENQGSISISHRAGLAAAACYFGSDHQIGIDLELIETRDRSFIEDFFTENEARSAQCLSEPERSIWVTLMWSAKEAVLKAWRKGLRIDTRTIEIQPIPKEEIHLLKKDWIEIQTKVEDTTFPPCTLFGRVLGDRVLTLAFTSQRAEIVRLC